MSAVSRDWDRRNVLRATAGVTAMGGLAACGGNTGRSSGSGSGTSISQWYHAYGETGTQQAAEKFAKAYKNADVSIQWIPGDFNAKLSSGMLSTKGPDVFEYHPDVAMVQAKQIVPLDDVIADVKDDFLPEDIAANSVDGKVYGIRMIDDPQFLYYRKSLLEEAGVTPPTTLEELIDAAGKLTTNKVKGLYLGLTLDPITRPLVLAAGQELLAKDNKSSTFQSTEVIDTLRKLRELYTSKSLLLGATTDWWDPSSFNQGLTAMQWGGIWSMPAIQKALGDDFGIVPWPGDGSKGRPVTYNGGWSTFVSAKAKDIDAAKEFVKWLWIEQSAYQEEWALSYGFHIPPRKSLADKADKLKTGTPAEAVKLFNESGFFDNPNWTPAMQAALLDAVSNSVRDNKDPESEMSKATTKVDRELKKLFG